MAVSCAHIAPFGLSGRYESALERFTRSGKAYHEFETRLIVDATYRAPAFLEAYEEEYASKYRLGDVEKEKIFEKESQRVRENHEFLVSLYTPVKGKKLPGRESSPWRFYLLDEEGERSKPTMIRKIQRDDTLTYFYPYIDEWSELYILDFPKEETSISETGGFSLMITGPYGEVTVNW